jgi:ArsR family transcriptional regulator
MTVDVTVEETSTIVNVCEMLVSMTATITAPRGDAAPMCCPPAHGVSLTAAEAEDLATALKAVADATRLRLVSLLSSAADGEACVCDLTAAVGLSQPTVSHHMKVLVDAGIATREKRGVWAYYRLVPDRLAALGRALTPPA